METFIKSLTTENRKGLGLYIVSSLEEGYSCQAAVEKGLAFLLCDEITRPEPDMDDIGDEGFSEYACQTAKQITAGEWNNLAEIQAEVNQLVVEYEKETAE